MSQLHIRGIRVQMSRLRASLHRINLEVIEMCRSHTVRCRVYSVDGPNSLWHLDGHHKLICWKLVTHGGIEGQKRKIVYLKFNFVTTVLQQFHLAVEKFGLPERVHSDKGRENIDVWQYMVYMHGSSAAVFAGSSTHNERLWHDVYRCVCCHYYELLKRSWEADN